MTRRRLDRGSDFRIEVRERDLRTAVVSIHGDLDLCSSFSVMERLSSVDAGTTLLVLDLSQLRFVDSAGVGVLLTVARRWMLGPGELRVVARPGRIRSVLTVAGLDRVVGVYPTLTDALSGPDGAPS